jgi:ABC-type transporter Mla maintaining outer membrane lipid asymmetry permease subunit MlaE
VTSSATVKDEVDIRGGFIKALVFAVIVSCVRCFQGYFCHMRPDGYGSKAVPLATVSAVVLFDELTGLLSREAFRVHYAAMLGGTARQAWA